MYLTMAIFKKKFIRELYETIYQTRAVTEPDKCPRKILVINHLLHVISVVVKIDKFRTPAVTFKLD
jgi:hypothetical protein